jgi:hypothetical protein
VVNGAPNCSSSRNGKSAFSSGPWISSHVHYHVNCLATGDWTRLFGSYTKSHNIYTGNTESI